MLMVLIAIGLTDLLFAFDSIPAIFGLTKEPYLVLMANVFALMGLRQLYFILGNLVNRLVYLNIGLGVLLGFIGFKLVFHALHENDLSFINGGNSVGWAPVIGAQYGLAAIVVILGTTVLASLWRQRQNAKRENQDATEGRPATEGAAPVAPLVEQEAQSVEQETET
jgi:tellurite resistance protein TerC